VISFLLVFISVGRHTNTSRYDSIATTWFASGMLTWSDGYAQAQARDVAVARVWSRCSTTPLSACDILLSRRPPPQQRESDTLLFAISIRYGMARCDSDRAGEMLTGEDREAAEYGTIRVMHRVQRHNTCGLSG